MDFTEEEQERYNFIKEKSILLYPIIAKDKIAGELAEHLFNYYAKNGCLPDVVRQVNKKEDEEAGAKQEP